MSETPAYRDESKLRELYVEKDFSMEELAEKFDVSAKTISNWCDKFGIKTGGKGAGSPYDVCIYTSKTGYVRVKNVHKKVRQKFLMHRLVAVAEYGFDAVANSEIHHKNNLRWDNRPSNLEVISPEEHGRLHANERWAKA
jgi:transposase-like protein